jgi:hypothetical protein
MHNMLPLCAACMPSTASGSAAVHTAVLSQHFRFLVLQHRPVQNTAVPFPPQESCSHIRPLSSITEMDLHKLAHPTAPKPCPSQRTSPVHAAAGRLACTPVDQSPCEEPHVPATVVGAPPCCCMCNGTIAQTCTAAAAAVAAGRPAQAAQKSSRASSEQKQRGLYKDSIWCWRCCCCGAAHFTWLLRHIGYMCRYKGTCGQCIVSWQVSHHSQHQTAAALPSLLTQVSPVRLHA